MCVCLFFLSIKLIVQSCQNSTELERSFDPWMMFDEEIRDPFEITIRELASDYHAIHPKLVLFCF